MQALGARRCGQQIAMPLRLWWRPLHAGKCEGHEWQGGGRLRGPGKIIQFRKKHDFQYENKVFAEPIKIQNKIQKNTTENQIGALALGQARPNYKKNKIITAN